MKQQVSRRNHLFMWLCIVCVLGIVLFGIFAARRGGDSTLRPNEEAAATSPAPATANINVRGNLYFRSTALGLNYGKLAVAPLEALDRIRYSTDLSCDRVYFAAGRGVCLAADRGVFTNYY